MQYVELHARSAFSFLEGGSLPESLACAEVFQKGALAP
jgi:DNA polymerase III alpha subunit